MLFKAAASTMQKITLSAASIFVIEGFLYTFISCYLKKIMKIGFPELEKKFLNDFALFSKNDCSSIKVKLSQTV